MAKTIHNRINFSGGLVSPKVDARADQAKYTTWLRQCENMIPYKTGALTRAPGTKYVGNAKLANTGGHDYRVRLQSFIFSPSTQFILEFGHQYIRFYANSMLPVQVSSAPTWVTATNYPAGSFVQDPGAGNAIYYSAVSINGGTVQPHLDPTHWVAQTIYEVPTPYLADASATNNLPLLAFCQINDVLYITHPAYPPYKLTQFSATNWVMQAVAFLTPALLDQNATTTTITPSALVGSGITLTASAPAWVSGYSYTLASTVKVAGVIYNCIVPNYSGATFAADLALGYWQVATIFNAQHIGSTWQLAVLRNASYVEYDGAAATGFSAGTSAQIQCLGGYEVHTYGVWSADIAIQRSIDGGNTWVNAFQVSGRSDTNIDLTGSAEDLGLYRIVVSNVAAPVNPGATNPRVVFECVDAFQYGLVTITAVGGAYSATANVVTQLTDSNGVAAQWVSGQAYVTTNQVNYNFINYTALHNVTSSIPPPQDPANWTPNAPGATSYWSEAAWSNYRGYPQAVTTYQQRLIYGGSGFQPQRIWGTVTNDIENFARGDQTQATDAFAFDLNAPGRGSIQWLIAQTDLFVGFSGAEWIVNSGSSTTSGATTTSAVTPSNISAAEQGTFGSAISVQPLIVGNAAFFAQRGADSIRQMLFSVYTGKYMSIDLSVLSDNLLSSGIVQMAYQSRWRHQGMLWSVTAAGTMVGLTYDLDQEIFGWTLRTTGQHLVDVNGNALASDVGFESVATLFGNGNGALFGDDQVWLVANRSIGGVQTRFIETISALNWEENFAQAPNAPAPNLSAAFYVDCGKTIVQTGTTVFGLSYLNGRYVSGIAGPAFGNTTTAFGPLLVAAGAVTLPTSVSSTSAIAIQIGLPIQYYGQPMRLDVDPISGNMQVRTKQAYEWYIRVWNSLGGSISNGTNQTPMWQSGSTYALGVLVISPITAQCYQAVAGVTSATDPSQDPANWVQFPLPAYQQPVPIPYARSIGQLPFAQAPLVTTPTTYKMPAQLQPTPDTDPVYIVQGNDALPLTVLGIFAKLDVTSNP